MKWLVRVAISCLASCLPQCVYSGDPTVTSHRLPLSYDSSQLNIYPRDSRPQAHAGSHHDDRLGQGSQDAVSAASTLRITQGGFYVYNPYLAEQQSDPVGSVYPPEFATYNFSTVNPFRRPYQGYIYESVYPLNALPPERPDLHGPVRVEAIGRPEPYHAQHPHRPWNPPFPSGMLPAQSSQEEETPPLSYIHRARPDLAAPQHVRLTPAELHALYSSEIDHHDVKVNSVEGVRSSADSQSRSILTPSELLELWTAKEQIPTSPAAVQLTTTEVGSPSRTFWRSSAARAIPETPLFSPVPAPSVDINECPSSQPLCSASPKKPLSAGRASLNEPAVLTDSQPTPPLNPQTTGLSSESNLHSLELSSQPNAAPPIPSREPWTENEDGVGDASVLGADESHAMEGSESEEAVKQIEGAENFRFRHRFRYAQPTRSVEEDEADPSLHSTPPPQIVPSFIHRNPWPFTLPSTTTPEPFNIEVVAVLESELHRPDREWPKPQRPHYAVVPTAQPSDPSQSSIGFLIDRRNSPVKITEAAAEEGGAGAITGDGRHSSGQAIRSQETVGLESMHDALLLDGVSVSDINSTNREAPAIPSIPPVSVQPTAKLNGGRQALPLESGDEGTAEPNNKAQPSGDMLGISAVAPSEIAEGRSATATILSAMAVVLIEDSQAVPSRQTVLEGTQSEGESSNQLPVIPTEFHETPNSLESAGSASSDLEDRDLPSGRAKPPGDAANAEEAAAETEESLVGLDEGDRLEDGGVSLMEKEAEFENSVEGLIDDEARRTAEGSRSHILRSRWSTASAALRLKQQSQAATEPPADAVADPPPAPSEPLLAETTGLLGAGFVDANKTGLLPFEAAGPEAVDEPPEISMFRSGQDGNESAVPQTSLSEAVAFPELGDGATEHPAPDVFSYCYPFTADEVVTKCSAAEATEAVGVYIPMMIEIQIKHEAPWYAKMKELKEKHHLQIIGIAYESPNWPLITEILNEHPKLFAGVMLEWIGPDACISDIPLPTDDQLAVIANQTTRNILRYFVRDQNFAGCNWSRPTFLTSALRKEKTLARVQTVLPIPERLQPVFACFGGQEGLCFSAFHRYPQLVCKPDQRYSFNPYEAAGGRMMHLFNETCAGLPPHDYYGTL